MKKILLTCVASASVAYAQTTFIGAAGDDPGLVGNWDNGLPTSPGNPGTLNSTATWNSANPTLTDYYLDIVTGGELTRSAFFTPQTIDGGVWTVNGGSINNTTVLNLADDATVTLNSGDITLGSGRDVGLGGTSSLIVNGGTLTVGDEINLTGGSFTMAGGTAVVNGGSNVGDNFNSTGTLNFNGGSFTASDYGSNGNVLGRTINFGLGSAGTVTFTGVFETKNTTIDWASGSLMSLTTGTLNNLGGGATYEDLWDAGILTVDGANSGTFESNFNVAGSTLTLIPEPSSVALLGMAGVGLAAFNRKRRF